MRSSSISEKEHSTSQYDYVGGMSFWRYTCLWYFMSYLLSTSPVISIQVYYYLLLLFLLEFWDEIIY